MVHSMASVAAAGEDLFLPASGPVAAAPDISALFPHGVLTSCEMRDNWLDDLLPIEARQLGDVCEKRAVEFAAGRNGARRLLTALHADPGALMIGDYRQPLWPEGLTGSISHADEICAVAVARRSDVDNIGIDVEVLEDLDDDVTDLVLTHCEQKTTARIGGWARKLIFSIKESNYKCCHHRVRAFIDFQQCEVDLNLSNQSYNAIIRCLDHKGVEVELHTHGRWLLEAGHIFSSAICR